MKLLFHELLIFASPCLVFKDTTSDTTFGPLQHSIYKRDVKHQL